MWFLIQKCNAIWHIDATGNILQPVYNRNPSLLYSIVVHDPQNHKNIPLFEYITSEQTVKQTSNFLYIVKHYCMKYKKLGGKKVRHAYGQIITTDFSYTLINSILKAFNNCDMAEYLQATYSYIVENRVPNIHLNVFIYLCSTHFLKSFIKKVNKQNLKNEDIENFEKLENKIKELKRRINARCKRSVIFCFTLLQNCITLEEFNVVLLNIFNFFNQPKKNETYFQSKLFIQTSIKTRKLEFDINFATSKEDRERSKISATFKNENTKIIKKLASESYKERSPWTTYFSNMI